MLIFPLVVAVVTAFCGAMLVLLAGYGVFWAFIGYSVLGSGSLLLASMVVAAVDVKTCDNSHDGQI
ncbi:hypothetical protein [Roseinatronobacter sp.]